jgi:hypothetical protein
MANNVIPGMAGIYVRSTGEHVSANIFGPSRHGDNYLPPTLSGDHHRLVPKKNATVSNCTGLHNYESSLLELMRTSIVLTHCTPQTSQNVP